MAAVVYEFNPAAAAQPRGIRVVVCDPDTQVRRGIRSAIQADSGLWLMSEACDWEECAADLESLLPELLIVRASLVPFAWRARLGSGDVFPVVITLGAAAAHKVPGDHCALSLPIEMEAAQMSLIRAATEIYNRKAQQLSDLLARYISGLGKIKAYPSTITVEQNRQPMALSIDTIRTVIAARKYAWIDSTSGRYLARKAIRQVAAELDPQQFVRIHRSIIVNLQYVDFSASIEHKLSHIVLLDGSNFPVGVNYRDDIASVLMSGRRE